MPTPEKPQDALSLKRAFSELTRLKTKLSGIFKTVEENTKRILDLGKEVRELKDMFSTNDNWGEMAKRLIESKREVVVTTLDGNNVVGIITWVDRYNIGFKRTSENVLFSEEGMFLKGGLTSIFPFAGE